MFSKTPVCLYYGDHVKINYKVIGFTASCDMTPIEYLAKCNKLMLPIVVPKGFLNLLFKEDLLLRVCYENNFTIYGINLKESILELDE